jgi:hypothetical protein
MSKKIGEKIYFFLIFMSVFVCAYEVIHNLPSGNTITYSDTNVDLSDDNNLTDNFQKSVDQMDESIIANPLHFNISSLSTCVSNSPYSQNIYEICLGLNTPPPKGV